MVNPAHYRHASGVFKKILMIPIFIPGDAPAPGTVLGRAHGFGARAAGVLEESFTFKKQPGISQKQIRGFVDLDFVAKAENIVFIDPT